MNPISRETRTIVVLEFKAWEDERWHEKVQFVNAGLTGKPDCPVLATSGKPVTRASILICEGEACESCGGTTWDFHLKCPDCYHGIRKGTEVWSVE